MLSESSVATESWYAVRTNPRCEERALKSVSAAGFQVYFPIVKRHVVHHRTRVLIAKTYPLLIGYIMAAFPTVSHASHARGCDGVRGVLGIEGRPQALPSREVSDILTAEAGMLDQFERRERELKNENHGYRAGDRVMFRRGPWNGFEATVVDGHSKRAVTVLMQVFNSMKEVEAPVDYFERAA